MGTRNDFTTCYGGCLGRNFRSGTSKQEARACRCRVFRQARCPLASAVGWKPACCGCKRSRCKKRANSSADLERRRKVMVYSAQNLHAKVFAFDRAIFTGSANASKHSATALQEAVVFTTDAAIGRAVRAFVKSLCLELLGPAELKRLQKLYRPPRFVRARSGKVKTKQRSAILSLRLAQLTEAIRNRKSLDAALEAGEKEAEGRRQRGKDHCVESFYWWGRSSWRTGQLGMEVFKERSGRRTVSPPGHVIHLRRWRSGKRRATCVFVEFPDRDWMSFSSLKRRFGQDTERYLKRGGFVRDQNFAKRLLSFWQEGVT